MRVELDGEPWRTLPTAAVVESRLVVGSELTRERARELRRELRRQEALSVATRTLTHRERSTASVAAALERKGVAAPDRVEAIGALERAGYLDDDRFAAGRAASLAARGYGNAAIEHDLEQQGLEREQIQAALLRLDDEGQRALLIVERDGRSLKTARRLAARGFGEDTVESVIGLSVLSDGSG